MVSFWVYDVAFLVLFIVFVIWFVYSHKKNLSREGMVFMYRTQAGVKAIKWVGNNCKCLLNSLKYIIIAVGVFLMGIMIWMLGQTLFIYIKFPQVTDVIKAPPIAPLVPYFPKLFGMEQFFPPFYFTYFIVALAIVAIVHEFSHGIFMSLFKTKIKSTGFIFVLLFFSGLFLQFVDVYTKKFGLEKRLSMVLSILTTVGVLLLLAFGALKWNTLFFVVLILLVMPLLGAFVEEEKKSFEKKKNIEQMTVLGAGVFANTVTALFFYGLYVLFFYLSFSASGYMFNTYSGLTALPVNGIASIESEGNLTKVITLANITYYLDHNLSSPLNLTGVEYILAYEDSPAVRAQLKGVIIQANDVKIKDQSDLRDFMQSKNPGEKVVFTTEDEGVLKDYNLVLGAYPNETGRAYLGIGYYKNEPRGIVQNFFVLFMGFKESSTRYTPNWDGNFVYFIYHLLWWVMVINILVAIFNMMPVGMLDGGRFFYLGILSITRSKSIAKWAFKISNYIILSVFILLMWFWFIRVI